MKVSADILNKLEKGDEELRAEQLRRELQLRSDRAARIILHILETSPDKYAEKVEKEIHKLEEKILKEYKRMHKKMQSYIDNSVTSNQQKINELKLELEELHTLA